ncbi:DNA-binding protein [Vreelandella rituensis]|uniref:DNA-binding protein n=1 Tax=Vreelandella rituensis TaxID=2282306 RepID=A0A368UAU0_9GAMM|nr:hypothetical protein DU506_00335 [Halomonas rituensis]
MDDFRKTRLGITNAARLLNVRVTELKDAIHQEKLLRGVAPPLPFQRTGIRQTEMLFNAGDVMDCAEALKRLTAKPQ